MKKLLVLILLSVWMIPPVSFAQGQKKYILEGKVTTYGTDEPVLSANVIIKELNVWGFSDVNGVFKITGIIPGTYILEATSLGYQKLSLPLTITKDVSGFKVRLKEENLTLSDVIVTAKKGGSMNSSSKVEKAAIEHVQASSLADVMQLMPGAIIQNPTLADANTITIRAIEDLNGNNSRGVGLMINGTRVTNDASINLGENSTNKTANSLDFRNYSTDNIESVEVLKGVLSAEYGDVTSGAILVTTKAGRTPYEMRVKSDPHTKAFAFSKGFSIGPKAGNINIDADYARAFSKWTSPVDIFDRTTMGITYSNTFNADKRPFRFNARLSGYISENSVESDPDVSKLDFDKFKENSLTLSLYGNWLINKPWITSLNYNVSGTYQKTKKHQLVVSSELPLPTTNTLTEGISIGTFTDTYNEKDMHVEEIPIYLNAKVSGNLNKKIGSVLSKTLLGAEWNTKGNDGRGVYYTKGIPQYFRERRYSDIPFMSDLDIFMEEKVNIPIVNTSLELSAGARFTKMFIDGYDYDPTIDPRFNGKYTVIKSKNDGVLRSLAFRGGWGKLQRLPSIVQLYPDPRYIDNPLFQYRNTTTGESLAVIQTSIIDDKLDYNLDPAKTTNMEIGIDLNIMGTDAQITYFNEKLKDGITPNYSYVSESYNYYNSVTDPNAAPKFENGKVWIKNSLGNYQELGYITNREFKSYKKPDNRAIMKKWGIEYDLDFGKIKPLNTSIIVNGSYIHSESTTPGLVYSYNSVADPIDPKQKLPYIGIYEGDEGMSLGTGGERLSTNIQIVAHIPSIRMIVSVITQCIWMENSWNIYDKGKIYTIGSDGQPVYGDYRKENSLSTIYRDPVAYMDHDGVIRSFSDYYTTTDQNLKTRLGLLRSLTNFNKFFKETGYDPYFMANLRITKEIGELASLSFYANNFTNSNPILKSKSNPNGAGYRVNTPIYFGAELKLTF